MPDNEGPRAKRRWILFQNIVSAVLFLYVYTLFIMGYHYKIWSLIKEAILGWDHVSRDKARWPTELYEETRVVVRSFTVKMDVLCCHM